jgi:hypothetical protein
MPNLRDVFFEGNPIYKQPQYRNKIVAILHALETIDSLDVVRSSLTALLAQ